MNLKNVVTSFICLLISQIAFCQPNQNRDTVSLIFNSGTIIKHNIIYEDTYIKFKRDGYSNASVYLKNPFSLINVAFLNTAHFQKFSFDSTALFSSINFRKDAYFGDTHFNSVLFSNLKFQSVDFTNAEFQTCNFYDLKIKGVAKFTYVKATGLTIEDADIQTCYFTNSGIKYLDIKTLNRLVDLTLCPL